SPGFTDPRQCLGHGEFCSSRCCSPSRQIRLCAIGSPCCKDRVGEVLVHLGAKPQTQQGTLRYRRSLMMRSSGSEGWQQRLSMQYLWEPGR
ncbi:unnamed protein product, partial [Caretta caretta]